MYVVAWLIEYYCFIPDFGERYAASMLEKLKLDGAGAAEIAKKKKEMESFTAMYKSPIAVTLITYLEILPVGLLLTLAASLILKRKAKPAI
jgi:hypothetical protein